MNCMGTLFHLQRTTMVDRRRQLRNNCTSQEKLLWKQLQGKKLGFKFIRQYSVDNYVVDFYCPEKRLAIELDGDIHFKRQTYDKHRTSYIEAFNVKIIRFKNTEIDTNIKLVLDKIILSLLD